MKSIVHIIVMAILGSGLGSAMSFCLTAKYSDGWLNLLAIFSIIVATAFIVSELAQENTKHHKLCATVLTISVIGIFSYMLLAS